LGLVCDDVAFCGWGLTESTVNAVMMQKS
jgi:hypothetical protein